MDIIKSYIEEINYRFLLDGYDFYLVFLVGIFKIVLYICGQDDVEVIRSYIIVIEYKIVLLGEIVIKIMDKIVMFVDNYGELEMIKFYIVFIDYYVKEKIVFLDRFNFELFKRKSFEELKVIFIFVEENVFFLKNGESDFLVVKVSQLILLGEWFNSGFIEKVVVFIVDDNMEVFKLIIGKNDKDV